MTAEDIAKYFLAKGMESDGNDLSNLKLQKLLYYAQGFHLALFDRPLFKGTSKNHKKAIVKGFDR